MVWGRPEIFEGQHSGRPEAERRWIVKRLKSLGGLGRPLEALGGAGRPGSVSFRYRAHRGCYRIRGCAEAGPARSVCLKDSWGKGA